MPCQAMSMYTDSKFAQITITTVHSILFIVDIAGNFLVCALVVKNSDMRYGTQCYKNGKV